MIEMQEVSKSFGDQIAVDQLNLNVSKGEIFGFLGPNGAGKTTSIRMLTGIIPPSKGTIKIQGVDIQKDPIHCKRMMGYIPDRPYVYEKLKGWEFVEFSMLLYENLNEESIRLANEYFELFQMEFARDRLIEDYSHGMKQKLVILASLLHQPQLLVIDEPMVGLDPRGAKTLKELFFKLREEGRTIFLSTHTMSVAQEVCDRIAIINGGSILATGTMEELRNKGHQDDSLEALFLKITEEERQESELAQAQQEQAGS